MSTIVAPAGIPQVTKGPLVTDASVLYGRGTAHGFSTPAPGRASGHRPGEFRQDEGSDGLRPARRSS
ncbi:MAG: hypothetical protein ACRDNS_03415 [Trebonia sp.]